MQIQKMHVTPQIAAEWLAKNTHNRALKKTVVEFYAQQIKAGQWVEDSGETIKFEGNFERLLDGQHRLNAIIAAKQALNIWVATNCPSDAFKVIDTGSVRRGSDVVSIEGYKDSTAVAAVIKATNKLFCNTNFSSFGWNMRNGSDGNNAKISNGQILQMAETLDKKYSLQEIATVGRTVSKRCLGILRAPQLGAAIYFLGEKEGYEKMISLVQSIDDKNHWVQFLMKAKLQKQYFTPSEYGQMLYFMLKDAKHGIVRNQIRKPDFNRSIALPNHL